MLHLRLNSRLLPHLARSASRAPFRLATLGLLSALVGAPFMLVYPHLATAMALVLATVIVGLAIALWQVGDQPAATQEAEFRALHDSLTGLPNRALFDDRFAHALAQSNRDGAGAAVMVIDLDRFKQVNDTHGHAAGDAVLRTTAERLAMTLRECDTVARIGGDEFGVVLTGIDLDGARESAARMHDFLSAPFDLAGAVVEVGASIGVAVHPAHGATPSALVQLADIAMYDAKRAGVGYSLFDAAAASSVTDRRKLARELRGAVARRELLLHYQARIDLHSDEVAAVEALARWSHPTLGLLAADTFMALGDENGLGTAIADHVIASAASQSAAWNAEGLPLTVAVNIDARSLADPGFPERVARLLDEHDVRPERIELEIGERALLAALKHSREIVIELARLGTQIVVDNFGTGNSSLGHLADVPISKLKLDRTLLLRAAASARERLVVAATVVLAHDLGLEVVAEGIEDEAGLDFVRSLGSDYAQGYHLGAPLPAEAFRQEAAVA
jgi:diguanylate cyclase